MRQPAQTPGATYTRRWRARKKDGIWVARIRLNAPIIRALVDGGFLLSAYARDHAAIERAVYDVISAAKNINLKLSADRRTIQYDR